MRILNTYINPSHVKTIKEGSRKQEDGSYEYTLIVEMSDGEMIRQTHHRSLLDETGNELLPIIPASPGYFALEFYAIDDSDSVEFEYESIPIIAWRIDDEMASPIVIDDRRYDAIQSPDGRVFMPFDESFKSATDWFESKKAEWIKRREAAAINAEAPAELVPK
jgi:hypothetical protein